MENAPKVSIENRLRRWGRIIHRDLSFFFAGILLVYAISGILLNHKRDFNSEYSVTQKEYKALLPTNTDREQISEGMVTSILSKIDKEAIYTKYYFPQDSTLKVFIKGGSSLVINLNTGNALYEILKKRHFFSAINRLHYNPGRYWTIFSDIFAISLIIIVFTGLIIVKGRKGIIGRGGIELLIGIAIPIIFIFLL